MTKWSEVTRSETPWNWRESLKRVVLTPSSFNNFLNEHIRRMRMDPEKKIEEEVPDMDEVSKTQEALEESDIDEEVDEEPESDIDETPN